jgi:putative ubiquitin-RnfH superfamily antitoxin RatB of RatAB toxin-antitoxin module
MKNAGEIVVEVAYARPEEQDIVEVTLVDGATAGQAIETSGILKRCAEIDLGINKIGVFGRPVGLDCPLRNQDRVEIYRPLVADPKEIRRQCAAAAKGMKKRFGRQ